MFTPRTLEVVMVSFEGPDQYSQAGGLGVRARELCRALAARGFKTTLAFVGDPNKPMTEDDAGVHLVRWAQDLSRRHLAGVYEGEWAKRAELSRTLPPYLIENIFRPAAEAGRLVAVLCEEWHTAEFCRVLSDHLHREGLRDKAVLLWNANNDFGFDTIDWVPLNFVASVTTLLCVIVASYAHFSPAQAVALPQTDSISALVLSNSAARRTGLANGVQ